VGEGGVKFSRLGGVPAGGLGRAAARLVGRGLGQNDNKAAQDWGIDVAKVAVILLLLIALPLALLAEPVLGLFIIEPKGISLGIVPLQLTALMMVVDASAFVLTQALLGAGASKMVMEVSVTLQWGVFIPLAFVFGVYLGFGLLAIWWVQLVYRMLNATAFIWLWRVKAWSVSRQA